jgi:hypothetical protein
MSLIFEGLKRNAYLKKQSARTALQTELSEEVTDSPTVVASLFPETHSQTLEEADPAPVTVDRSTENNSPQKNDPVQIVRSEELDTASANESPPPQTQPLKIQSQSTATQHTPNTKQIGRLRNGSQRSRFAFKPENSVESNFLSAFKGGLASSSIVLESLLAAPYKLLKFFRDTLLKFINFCSNWIVLLGAKLRVSVCLLASVTANVFTKLFQLCSFTVLRLPILALETIGSFFQRLWFCIRDYAIMGIHALWATVRRGLLAIGAPFSSVLQCYRTALDKVLSIYLPTSWIQNATAFLLKSSAIAISCCFAVVAVRNGIRSSTSQGTGNASPIALKENTTSQHQLKHLFKDPLVIKQEKVRDALLAFHIDTIQRYGDGKGQVIADNKNFGIGSLLSEHPKIYLEKIGKNSLYFADKYGQQYKRSIGSMLE